MADVNLASLNFKLIINDDEFNQKIGEIQANAKALNESISEMLNVKGGGLISKDEHESAMRRLREEFQEAMNQQKMKLQWSKETAKMANDEAIAAGKIAQQQEKVNNEKRKGLIIDEQIAAATQKKEAAEINAATATERKTKAERDAARAEIQRQTAAINQAAAEERKATATNNRIRSQQRLNAEMDREGTILRRNHRIWNDMKNVALAYFSFEGARRLVSNLIRVSAEFEKQRVSLHAILQDADGAERIFAQIKNLAVQSPFQFKELVTYTKQLSAFSIPMNELYDTTKMLADVSAGLGVGMDRLVLAYGQIRSASFLRGQEVRQLTEAGIPILTELAKQFEELEGHAVSAGDVFDKISRRQVTFEMVEKVFKDMTSEGGKFYQMQEVLAQTLSGKISNLTDAYQIMFAEIGEKTSGILNGTVDTLRSIAENYTEIGRRLVQLIAIYGVYRTTVAAVTLLEKQAQMIAAARMGGETISKVTALGRAIESLTGHTKAYHKVAMLVGKVNPYALAFAGTAILITQVVNLIRKTSEYKKVTDSLTDTVAEYNSNITVETTNLDYLFGRLYALDKETAEYKKVKDEIINQYGQYLSDIDKENLRIKNLAGIYGTLADAIKNASMEKAIAAGREKIAEFQSGITTEIWKQFGEAMEREGLDATKGIGKELTDYVTGAISGDKLSEAAIQAGQRLRIWAKTHNLARSPWEVAQGEDKAYDFFGMRQALENMRGTTKELTDNFVKQIGFTEQALRGANGAGDEMLKSWRADLAAIAKEAETAGHNLDITINAQSDLLEVREDLDKEMQLSQKRYDAYLAAGEKGEAAIWKSRMDFLKRMKSRVGDDGGSGAGGGGSILGASDDQTKDIVSNIQAQIRVYERLKDTYESLIATMSDEDARRLLELIYPQYGDMVGADFSDSIQQLSDELLEMSLYSDAAATAWMALQDAFSEDKSSTLIKSAQAAEKYREEIQKWIDEGYDLKGSGFSFDISKILRGLAGQNASTDKTFEALKKSVDEQEEYYKAKIVGTEEEREKAWQSYKSQQYKILDDIAAHEKENNRKVAEDKINDLAQRYVNEMYKTNADGAIELSDWGDKSLSQITRISEALRHLMTQDLQLPEDIIDDANEAQVTLEDLGNLIRAIFTADYKTTIEERVKRIGNIATNVSNLVAKMGSSLASLGDNIENDVVKDFGEMLNVITQISSAITDCEPLMRFLSSTAKDAADNWKALLNSGDLLTMAVKLLGIGMEQIVKHITTQYEKQQAIVEAAKEYKKTLDEIALSQYDGVLGVNDMGKLAEYYKQMSEASKEWASAVDEINRFDNGKIGDYLLSLLGEAGYDLKHLDLSQLKELYATLKQLSAQGYVHDTLLAQLDEYITKIESYEEAISDIFSKVADDIVDNLVDAFDEVGDSVAHIEDAFYDLGDVILRSVLRSMVLENIVEKYKDDFMKAVTEYALTDKTENDATALAAQLGTITSSLREELEDSGGIFNAIIEAFRDAGLVDYNMDNEVSNTVGGGIKSITEDTANLLASYINAIRADVAAIRQAVAAGNTNTLPSPTLAEYLTQIQANTYNNAVAAQAILENLQSMMTTSDGPALRVFM